MIRASTGSASTRALRPAGYAGKRLLDLALVVPSLVVVLPAAALLALLIWVAMGAPVLFRQRRPGLFGEPFTILKFRTMSEARAPDGRLRPDGDRLTRLGRFLRSSSLDELPELMNVLRGEMSLVGPRPLVMEYLPFYRDRERTRFLAKPGIAGLAQVSGRNFLGWDERLELDARYVEQIGFWPDVRILAQAVAAVLLRRGVSPDADQAETWLHEERGGGAHGCHSEGSDTAVTR